MKNQLELTRSNLRDVLLEEYMEKYFKLEADLKSVFEKHIVQEDCSFKVRNHLERLEKKLRQKKLKKLHKFYENDNFYFDCLERFGSHDESFSFTYNFVSFCISFVPDFENLHYLLTLNDNSNESTLICDSCKTFWALFDLKNDKTIVIKGANKETAVVVWDRDDYFDEAEKQLGDKEVYEEVNNDPQPFTSTIHRTVEKIRKRGHLPADNIKQFMVKDPKFARFYLLTLCQKSTRG